MKDKFLEAIKVFKERTEKECYKVDYVIKDADILEDKMGGKPYLPIGEKYPVSKSGVPMGLLLQVNLKNIKLEGYPNEGILEIFVDSEFGWPLEYEIKVFKEGLEYQKEFPKIDYSNFPFEKTFAITYTKDVCHMPLSDYRFSDLFVEVVNEVCGLELENVFDCDDVFDFDWYELVANNIKNHPITIGGYADFTQNDPRDGELEGADECLFKLDSASDYNNFCVGDSGIIFVLISMENIVNGHLDKAVVDWDCC